MNGRGAGCGPPRAQVAGGAFSCLTVLLGALAAAPTSTAGAGDALRALPHNARVAIVLRAADRWLPALARAPEIDRRILCSGLARLGSVLAGAGRGGEARIRRGLKALADLDGDIAGDAAAAWTRDGAWLVAIEAVAGRAEGLAVRLAGGPLFPQGARARARDGLVLLAPDDRAIEGALERAASGGPPERALALALAGSAETAIVALVRPQGVDPFSIEVPIRDGRPGPPLACRSAPASARRARAAALRVPAGARSLLFTPDPVASWRRLRSTGAWAILAAPDRARVLAELFALLTGGERRLPATCDPAALEEAADLLIRGALEGPVAAALLKDGLWLDLGLAPPARVVAEIARCAGSAGPRQAESRLEVGSGRLRILLPRKPGGEAIQLAGAPPIPGPPGPQILTIWRSGDPRHPGILPPAGVSHLVLGERGGLLLLAPGPEIPGKAAPSDGRGSSTRRIPRIPHLGQEEIASLVLEGPPDDALALIARALGVEENVASETLAPLRGYVQRSITCVLAPPEGRPFGVPDLLAWLEASDLDALEARVEDALSARAGRPIRLRAGAPPATGLAHGGVLLWRIEGIEPSLEAFWSPVSARVAGGLLLATSVEAARKGIDGWGDAPTRGPLEPGEGDDAGAAPRAALALRLEPFRRWAIAWPGLSWSLASRFGWERAGRFERSLARLSLPLEVRLAAGPRAIEWTLIPSIRPAALPPSPKAPAPLDLAAFDPPRTEVCALRRVEGDATARAIFHYAAAGGVPRLEVRVERGGGAEPLCGSASFADAPPQGGSGAARTIRTKGNLDPEFALLAAARLACAVLPREPGAIETFRVAGAGMPRSVAARISGPEKVTWKGRAIRAWRTAFLDPVGGQATLWIDGRRRVLASRSPGWEGGLVGGGTGARPRPRRTRGRESRGTGRPVAGVLPLLSPGLGLQ